MCVLCGGDGQDSRQHYLTRGRKVPVTSFEHGKALVRRLCEEGIDRQGAAASAAFYTTDAKNHGRTVGQEAMWKVFEALFATFPDFH